MQVYFSNQSILGGGGVWILNHDISVHLFKDDGSNSRVKNEIVKVPYMLARLFFLSRTQNITCNIVCVNVSEKNFRY